MPNDRELAGLRGNVKTVETSRQETDRAGKPAYPIEKESTDEFDRSGTLIRTTHHVSGGRSLYFTLEGNRVSLYEQIPGAKPVVVNVPVGSASSDAPPEPAKAKGDSRFESRYEYKIDTGGRVTAIKRYDNGGSLRETRKFTYDAAGRIATETLVEPKGPVLGDIYHYDANGGVTQRDSVFYLASGGSEVTPFRYSNIKLDEHGNWIERAVSQVDESGKVEVIHIETRKITYH